MDCKLTATDMHTGCQENRPGTERNTIKDLPRQRFINNMLSDHSRASAGLAVTFVSIAAIKLKPKSIS